MESARILYLRIGVCVRWAYPRCERIIFDGKANGAPHLTGGQASHAWLAVFCPAFGWIDFDPTNNMIPSDQHITLAWGRDYDDVSPVRGVVLGGGQHTISVNVSIVCA